MGLVFVFVKNCGKCGRRSEGSERRGNGVACVSIKLQRMQRVQEFEEQQMQCFWGQIWDRNAKRWHKQI